MFRTMARSIHVVNPPSNCVGPPPAVGNDALQSRWCSRPDGGAMFRVHFAVAVEFASALRNVSTQWDCGPVRNGGLL